MRNKKTTKLRVYLRFPGVPNPEPFLEQLRDRGTLLSCGLGPGALLEESTLFGTLAARHSVKI